MPNCDYAGSIFYFLGGVEKMSLIEKKAKNYLDVKQLYTIKNNHRILH